MRGTVVGLVTPHLLRVVDLAHEADKGINVDWHVRDAVGKTLDELGEQYNGPALIAAYAEGLENVAAQPGKQGPGYFRVLKSAASTARSRL